MNKYLSGGPFVVSFHNEREYEQTKEFLKEERMQSNQPMKVY